MKRKMLLILPVVLLFNCISVNAQAIVDVSATQTTPTSDESGRYWIYYATWEKWGHGSDCRGWGLCQFNDCWFCDVADKHRAKVLIDKKTNAGEMLIELDPANADEKKAIAEKSVFIIAADIKNPNSVLYKGDYTFDSSIGKHGGYRLKISLK